MLCIAGARVIIIKSSVVSLQCPMDGGTCDSVLIVKPNSFVCVKIQRWVDPGKSGKSTNEQQPVDPQ